MRIKHYYCFEKEAWKKMHSNKLNMENWDVLRTYETKGEFSIERTIDDYISNCERKNDYKETAKIISNIIKRNKWKNAVSMGAGKCILEYHIKKLLPELNIECTDYTQKSLALVEKVFINCNGFFNFDMLYDDYNILKEKNVIIMNRVSTEFTRRQWKEIFQNMYNAGIQNIIFIPTEIMTFRMAIEEMWRYLINIIHRRKNIFCGWMYSRREYLSFFEGVKTSSKLYTVECSYIERNSEIFVLKRSSDRG